MSISLVPGSTNEIFCMLQVNGYIHHEVTEKIVAALGFGSLPVYEYAKVDLEEAYRIYHDHIGDLLQFLKAIFKKKVLASIASNPAM